MKLYFTFIFSSLVTLTLCFAEEPLHKNLWDKPLQELLDLKVTTATRQESRSFLLPSIVTVISGEQLRRWGARNLADGLRQAAGIVVRKAPGDFPQYSTAIRGNTSDFMNMRALFLIDGVAVRNPNAGFDPSWIPLEIISKVEIVKGPVSSLYGANAFGGVVNVITQKGKSNNDQTTNNIEIGAISQKDHVTLDNIAGSNFSLTTGKEKMNWNYFATATYKNRDESDSSYSGYTYQDVYGKTSVSVTENIDVTFAALFSFDRNQIATSNSNSPIKNDFTHIATTADIKLKEDSDLKVTAYLNKFDHFLKYTDSLEKYDNQGTAIGVNFVYSKKINLHHKIIAGLEYSNENGSLATKEMDYSTFTVSDVGWDNQNINTYSAYIQDQFSGWQNTMALLGVRYDYNTLFDGTISPRAGISYLLSEKLSLFAATGQAFRAPVFNETHIDGFGKVGNENLKPELTLTYEVGIKNIGEYSENAASIFLQDIRKKIDLRLADSTDPDSLSIYDNLGSTKLFGAEWSGSYRLYARSNIFYSAMWTTSDSEADEQERTKLTLGFDTSINDWNFATLLTHKGKVFAYDSSGNKQFTEAATTADIQIKKDIFELTQVEIFIRNLFDVKYKESYSEFIDQNGLLLPGRTIGLNLRSQF